MVVSMATITSLRSYQNQKIENANHVRITGSNLDASGLIIGSLSKEITYIISSRKRGNRQLCGYPLIQKPECEC